MKKIDFHVHITEDATVEESIKTFSDMCLRKGYLGVGIMAASYSSTGVHLDCNEKALAVRAALPNSYAFASLHHDRDFVEQAREYMRMGFEGIKLLEGKPSLYRHYGYGFDHPRYEPFFAYAEEQRIPLLIHNNDPAEHWDITKMSPRAIEKGWYYDSTMPSQAHFFRVLEDVLAKHPHLHVALAHFGFYANDLDHAEALLQAYPHLMLDVTPALIIYDQLSQDPERTGAFFRKFHERLIYGTDAENVLVGESRARNDQKTELMRVFYESNEKVTIGAHTVHGIALDRNMLENIYYYNAMRFIGKQ